MAGKAAQSVVKAIGGYQYPWKEKLAKYKDELSKGVWGYWELGAWKDLGISARRRARLRKEVLLAGQDWPYDPARKEMRSKRKGHKCDRISAEKRANTAELMKKMPEMLLDYKKRRWEKKMKEEDAKNPRRKEPKIASSNAVVESDGQEEIEEGPSESNYSMERELGTSTGDDEECCCVCLSRLIEGDQTRRLPCFHMFHKMCVGRWLDLCCKTCPLCRFSVEGESSQRKEEELTEEMVIWFSSFHAAGF